MRGIHLKNWQTPIKDDTLSEMYWLEIKDKDKKKNLISTRNKMTHPHDHHK